MFFTTSTSCGKKMEMQQKSKLKYISERVSLRPNVHTIHPKFYVILVIFNTI